MVCNIARTLLGPVGDVVEGGGWLLAEAMSRGTNDRKLSSSSLSTSIAIRASPSPDVSSGSRAGAVTQAGAVDCSRDCASLLSSKPHCCHLTPGKPSPKPSNMSISMRPAEKSTTAWSITPLIQIGVQAKVCNWWERSALRNS